MTKNPVTSVNSRRISARTPGRTAANKRRPNEFWLLHAALAFLLVVYASVGAAFFNYGVGIEADERVLQLFYAAKLLAAAFCVATFFTFHRSSIYFKTCLIWALPYAAFSTGSIMWSGDVDALRRSSVLLVGFIAAAGLILSRLGPLSATRVLGWFLALIVISSLVISIGLPSVGTHASGSAYAGAWRGVVSHKNTLGAYSAFATIIFWTNKQLVPNRLLLWALRVGAVICLACSQSSTALASVIAGLTAWLLFYQSTRMSWPTFIFRIFLGFFITAATFAAAPDIIALLGRDMTLSSRTDIWQFTWEQIAVRPLLGWGEGASASQLGPSLQLSFFDQATDAHSGYLDRAYEVGYVGLLLLLMLALVALLRARTGSHGSLAVAKANSTLATLVIAALVQAIGEVGIFRIYGTGFIFFYACLAVSVPQIRFKGQRERRRVQFARDRAE